MTKAVADGAETRASTNSQRAGEFNCTTRRSAAAIDGAERHVKLHSRKSADALHAVQSPGTTAPVTGSVRRGVEYSARASVSSSRPSAKAGSSGHRNLVSATRTTPGGPATGSGRPGAAVSESQPAASAAAKQSAASPARGRARRSSP
jgi:hypothetical protein